MKVAIRWTRLFISYCLFMLMCLGAFRHELVIYLLRQGHGQLHVLMNRVPIDEYRVSVRLSAREIENLGLIESIRKYSEDSLGYAPTDNFKLIYDQKGSPLLWVITASYPYELKPFLWEFPLIGRVSYKGFFDRSLAEKEALKLKLQGFDTDIRSVSAWSTLGWLDDPLLSNMLKRSKGQFCNLLFHELFHATFYASDNVDLNENLANFIAHKATLQFLSKDRQTVQQYKSGIERGEKYMRFMQRKHAQLKAQFLKHAQSSNKYLLKLKFYVQLSDSIRKLPYLDSAIAESRINDLMAGKNAVFIDYEQYEGRQDSLENVFNKIYKGDLKKMVRDLRQN